MRQIVEANYRPPFRAVGGGLQLSAAEGESEQEKEGDDEL